MVSDNRLANLRLATHKQNMWNSPRRKHSRQPYKGVRKDTRNNRWTARISADGKIHFLGSYATAEHAHSAYMAAARRLHGEFARFA